MLRDKRTATARGYVRLSLAGRQMNVYASAPLRQGKYTLLLFGRGFTQRLYMKMNGKFAMAEGNVLLPQNERILAAVMSGGKMLLLGESDGTLSDWQSIELDALNRSSVHKHTTANKQVMHAVNPPIEFNTIPKHSATLDTQLLATSTKQQPSADQSKPAAIRQQEVPDIPISITPADFDMEDADAMPDERIVSAVAPSDIAEAWLDTKTSYEEDAAQAQQPEQPVAETLITEHNTIETQQPKEQMHVDTQTPPQVAQSLPQPEPQPFVIVEPEPQEVEASTVQKVAMPTNILGSLPALSGEYEDLWEWESVIIPGSGYTYLLGHVDKDGQTLAVAVAVPGEYAPSPPPNLADFSAYSAGYWVLAQNASTGERLNIRPRASFSQ